MRFKSVFAALFLFLPLTACQADTQADPTYTEGTDFRTIEPPLAAGASGGKVQVMELFYYGCPHCYELEPHIQAWLKTKPANVEFVRVPAVFKREDEQKRLSPWYLQAKAFYVAEALGMGEKLHPVLFGAIHEKNRALNSEAELTKFFSEQGVAADTFRATFNSFSVETKVARAMDLSVRSGISGVPALIVGGKYQTLGKRATSYDDYLAITKHLIKRVAASR